MDAGTQLVGTQLVRYRIQDVTLVTVLVSIEVVVIVLVDAAGTVGVVRTGTGWDGCAEVSSDLAAEMAASLSSRLSTSETIRRGESGDAAIADDVSKEPL